jgi:hypothetical protein
MKFVSNLLTAGCILVTACGSFSLKADEPKAVRDAANSKAVRSTVAPNAAGIYWQAFSAMPTLNDEHKKSFEAAVASVTTPLTADLTQIVSQFRVSLHELHRARAVGPCDWQLDLDAGPQLLMPHLQKARELSRPALLRARLRFAAGETDAAISDVLDVSKMARDCGCQPILISFLVNVAIEKMTTDVLAAHLPLLKPEQLDRLAAELQKLPPTSDVANCIQWEERLFGDWLARRIDDQAATLNDPQAGGKLLRLLGAETGLESELQPKPDDAEGKRKADLLLSLTVAEVRASLKQMRADYAELGVIAKLPFAEQAPRLKKLEDSLTEARKLTKREDAVRYFSTTLLPTVSKVLLREEQFLARRGLLEQAIRVQRHGADALQPVRSQKVEHKKTTNGFELRCPVGNGEEVLVVGKAT